MIFQAGKGSQYGQITHRDRIGANDCRPHQIGECFYAAQTASGASLDGAEPQRAVHQVFGRDICIHGDAFRIIPDLDVRDISRVGDYAFRARNSDDQIVKMVRSGQHDDPRSAIEADFDRRFLGDVPGRSVPVAARIAALYAQAPQKGAL